MPSNQVVKMCSVLTAVTLIMILSGCREKRKEAVVADTVEVSVAETPTLEIKQIAVHFAYKQTTLNAAAEQELTDIAQQAKDNPGYQIELVGHADAVASDAYNMRLSQQRAEAVRDFLVMHGVAADRMTLAWRGEAQPVAVNTTEDGRAQNRRTEITLRPLPEVPTPTAMREAEAALL